MTSNRRSFIRTMGLIAGTAGLTTLANESWSAAFHDALERSSHKDPVSLASDEDFWATIQQAYTVSSGIVNLNNGGVSPQPKLVQDALDRYNRMCNEGPSYYMWRILDQGREPLRERLAHLAGAQKEEIAINRNATEALNTIIFGLKLKAGDEVVLSKQDYPNMINAWKQREQRDGIKLVWLDFEYPIENAQAIADRYTKAFTPHTKVVHITHMVNWVGQILPVAMIAKVARAKNIDVLVDGAHSFGLMDFKIPDLGADYFGTSLHKFLSAPFGSGMLYVRKEKIKDIWPLVCNDKPLGDDIRKFETLGTRSFPIEQAIGEALTFHNNIGSKRKEERIRYLKNYWAEQAAKIPGVKIHTSLKSEFSCAICGVSVAGLEPSQLEDELFTKHRIHTVGIVWENIKLVRVTPHVYTKIEDLDRLVAALKDIAARVSMKAEKVE